MATTINKQRLLNHLLNSPLADAPEADSLPVLEQFIFGLCRENATAEQAALAYKNLKTRFFDWNEVRVSSIRELEEAMAGLSDTETRAQRLVAFLQEVFEDRFSFDLDGLLKKGLKQAAAQLSQYKTYNVHVGAWVMQRSLGGHAIPVDTPTLRCSRRLGLVDATTEDPEAARSSLEHLVPKAKGTLFTDAVSNLAERYCWEDEPACQECPLRNDCCHAQEMLGEQLASARTARAKPR
jgi:endonuclease-3